ncbi:hypothetical protein EBZ38_09610 [bacterium]|nr:hypothetical protein [bacterium]NDD84510.1 hypothetical protein [bacterium]
MGACTFANRRDGVIDNRRFVDVDVTCSSSYATGGDTVSLATLGLKVCDEIHVVGPVSVDSGVATSATATTLVDSAKAWTVNGYANYFVRILRGTGAGQIRKITSNTATALTVPTWTITPDATSVYAIDQTSGRELRPNTSDPTAPTVMLFSAAQTEVTAATSVTTSTARLRFYGS